MARKNRIKKNLKFPDCKYRCQKCDFRWHGYRKDPTPPAFYIDSSSGGVGATICPKCGHEYIDWVNYESFAEWYCEHIHDGGCGGEIW